MACTFTTLDLAVTDAARCFAFCLHILDKFIYDYTFFLKVDQRSRRSIYRPTLFVCTLFFVIFYIIFVIFLIDLEWL